MKKARYIYPILLLASLVTAACGAGGGQPEAQAASEQQQAAEEKIISVEVAEVKLGDISQFFSYAGDLQPQKEISIIPEVGGKVESLLVDVGDEVAKGDTIAAIEQDSLLIELQQAEAALKSAVVELNRLEAGLRPEEIAVAQAAVQSAKAQLSDVITIDDDERTQAATALANAQADLKAAQEAYDKVAWAGDIGSRPEAVALEKATVAYETALANYNLDINPRDSQVAPLMENLARAELNLSLALTPYREFDFEAARAGIEQAEAAVKQIQLRLEKTIITAPFDGIIAETFIEEGSIVNTQSAIAELVSSDIEVLINAEESLIGQLSVGQNATLKVQAYPDVNFPAIVTSIAPVGDPTSRTFEVTVTPQDEEGLLKSGMYADLSILSQEKQDVPLVPRSAIVSINNEPTVYVVIDKSIAEQRPVTTGLSNTEQIEILDGLNPGDTVVIAGQPNLADGAKVEIVSGF